MFEHLTNKQKSFIRDVIFRNTARINLLQGSVRSGKTFISLIAWIIMICEYPENSPFLMVGKTLTSLKRNCLSILDELCPPNSFTYSISKKEAKLYGRKIYLEGVNDSRAENKIRGMTLQGAYCDELTLFSADFFSMLLSRLSMRDSKLLATTNPDTPQHWLMKDYINRQDELDFKTWEFLLDDNDTIPQDIRDALRKEYTGVFYDRFILGKWVSAEGLIYRIFAENHDSYIVDKINDKIAFISIGIDYGASKSKTVFVATAVTLGFKNVIVIAEKSLLGIYDPESIYDEFEIFYKNIKDNFYQPNLVFADYGALGEVLTRGLSNRVARKGIPIRIENCTKSTINDRIQLTCKLMAQKRLKILSSCKGLIGALDNAIWDIKKVDSRLDDGTVEIDYLDAFEYSINNFSTKLILSGR